MSELIKVKIGQIWQDTDPRLRYERTIEVLEIGDTHAKIRSFTSGKISNIRLDRFKPGSTGYKLIKDVPL